ncbi:MAG TPA: DNA-processing protein DprA [Patescibacteria group bacterium]
MSNCLNSESKHYLGFSLIENLGPVNTRKILKYFKSIEAAWRGSFDDFIRAGLGEKLAREIINQRQMIDPEQELVKIQKHKISLINIENKNYSALLKEIYAPPPLLYYQGNIRILNQLPVIAVVGTRKVSSYGRQVTQELVKGLVAHNFIIVSGLALGIDSIAHQTTFENSGYTIAVLGCGLETIYPRSAYPLAKKIISQKGLLLSEFPLGTQPFKQNFPRRNRIIAGLSQATLVIEAGQKSGALITAYNALEQNREVFAVPGNIFSQQSKGTNHLIKKGARLVESVSDIIEALDIGFLNNYIERQPQTVLTPDEEGLMKFLSKEPLQINKLIQLTGLSSAQIMTTVTNLELKGRVKNLGGSNYVIIY